MKLFYDEALKRPIEETLELGEVWLLEDKKKTVWLLNDSGNVVRDIHVVADAKSVMVKDVPAVLESMEKAPFTLTWNPKGLKDLKTKLHVDAVAVESGKLYEFDLGLDSMQFWMDPELTVSKEYPVMQAWLLNTSEFFLRDISIKADTDDILVMAPHTLKSGEKALVTLTSLTGVPIKDWRFNLETQAIEVDRFYYEVTIEGVEYYH